MVKFDAQTRFPHDQTLSFSTFAAHSAGHCTTDVAFESKHKSADVSRNGFLIDDQAMQQKSMERSSYGCPAMCCRHLQSFKVGKNDGGF
jgi:hypothetical protein